MKIRIGVSIAAICAMEIALGSSASTPIVGTKVVESTARTISARPIDGTVALPAALRPAFYQALAKDAGPAYAVNKNGCATMPKQALNACFGSGGVHFNSRSTASLSLHLVAFGRGTALAPVKPVHPEINGHEVQYRHSSLTEWWRVLPMGFEQGFNIAKRPAGHGELTLALVGNDKAQQATTRRSKKAARWLGASSATASSSSSTPPAKRCRRY